MTSRSRGNAFRFISDLFRAKPTAPPPEPSPSTARAAAEQAADDASAGEYEKRRYDLALGGLDRSRVAAASVATASSAIALLYTGALGLIFSATGKGLPLRGLLPTIFLGLAVVLSAYFTSFITRPRAFLDAPPGGATWRVNVEMRLNVVTDLITNLIEPRAWAMRSAVLALAVGLMGIPLPFLSGDALAIVQSGRTSAGISASAAPAPWNATDWPTPPPAAWPPEVAKVKYQAQVKQYVDQAAKSEARAEAAATRPHPLDSLTAFALLLAAGLFVVALPAVAELQREIRADRSAHKKSRPQV